MAQIEIVVKALAHAALAGEMRLPELAVRLKLTLTPGRQYRWMRAFAARMIKHFGESERPRAYNLIIFILRDAGFRRAFGEDPFGVYQRTSIPAKMCPTAGPPQDWKVPAITTTGDLARILNLTPGEMNWFCHSWQERRADSEKLAHYKYHWRRKRDGTARLIEAPKQRLKLIQQYILSEILSQIPPHEAAHGFRKSRSIKTFALPHVGKRIVLRLDIKNFFPSVTGARVRAIFRTAGYPESVASALAGLCSARAPLGVFELVNAEPREKNALKNIYGIRHLPQGAPSSPMLANLSAFRLDCRLAGLAKKIDAAYTRYADDLVFSGGEKLARGIERFYIKACAIALEEGFELNTRKTRIMRPSLAQKAAGLVLNSHLNVPRSSYDQLKAILYNCAKHGPESQNKQCLPNFREHLRGRIAHVEMANPARAQKLITLFQKIAWT
jgi:RNA-directed DNA polymerase